MSGLIERAIQKIDQSVSAGDTSSISQVSQHVSLSPEEQKRFFSMQVLRATSGQERARTTQLEAGNDYIVRVSVGSAPFAPAYGETSPYLEQRACVPRGTVVVEIKVDRPDHVVSAHQCELLRIDDPAAWCDVQLSVDAACPSGDLHLSLMQRDAGATVELSCVAVIRIPVQGQTEQPKENLQAKTRQLPLDIQPPAEMAFLYIQASDAEHIQIVAKSHLQPDTLIPIGTINQHRVTFNEDETEDDYIDRLIDISHDISRDEIESLPLWIKKMLETPKSCCFAVIDLADSGIPWEMLRVSDRSYLGIDALVVRLADEHYRNGSMESFFREYEVSGRTVACAPHNHQARSFFKHLDKDLIEELKKLQHRLRNTAHCPVGFVCVTADDLLLYSDEQDVLLDLKKRYHPHKIRFNITGKLPDPRPFFFVSAPFSARALRAKEKSRGIIHGALSEVATNYIGAIGPIHGDHANLLAQQLYDLAREADGVQPALLLRQLRIDTLKELERPDLSDDESEWLMRKLYYLGTYVYYGNPHMRLRLRDAENGQ